MHRTVLISSSSYFEIKKIQRSKIRFLHCSFRKLVLRKLLMYGRVIDVSKTNKNLPYRLLILSHLFHQLNPAKIVAKSNLNYFEENIIHQEILNVRFSGTIYKRDLLFASRKHHCPLFAKNKIIRETKFGC